jgi:protein-tyrosine phosphatase
VHQAGLDFAHLPIIDMAPPEDFSEASEFVSDIAKRIQDGHNVAMHCRYACGLSWSCALLALSHCKSEQLSAEVS